MRLGLGGNSQQPREDFQFGEQGKSRDPAYDQGDDEKTENQAVAEQHHAVIKPRPRR